MAVKVFINPQDEECQKKAGGCKVEWESCGGTKKVDSIRTVGEARVEQPPCMSRRKVIGWRGGRGRSRGRQNG